MSSFLFHASIIGVSAVSVAGIFRSWNNYRQHQLQTERRLLEDIAGLSRAIEKKEREILSLRERLDIVTAEVVAKGAMITSLERQIEYARGELAERDESVKRAEAQSQELVTELEALKSAAANGKVKHSDEDESPEASSGTAEEGLSSSVSTVQDRHTVDEVMTMLQVLNSEIYQLALCMAQRFSSSDVSRGGDEPEDWAEAERQAIEVLGEGMVALLRQDTNNRDPTLLRFAFQACMSAFSDWMASSWYFEDPDSEQVLTRLYEKIRESEDQLTAGRWRTLTRTHVQRMISNKPDISEYFLDAFSNILVAIGFGERQHVLQDIITSEFGGRMEKIGHLALQLNKGIGEGIVSIELEPIYVAPGVAFDPSVMDDDEQFASLPGDSELETILCTTELGLLCTAEGSGLTRWDEKVLRRPRVVRRSRLRQA